MAGFAARLWGRLPTRRCTRGPLSQGGGKLVSNTSALEPCAKCWRHFLNGTRSFTEGRLAEVTIRPQVKRMTSHVLSREDAHYFIINLLYRNYIRAASSGSDGGGDGGGGCSGGGGSYSDSSGVLAIAGVDGKDERQPSQNAKRARETSRNGPGPGL
jgi:hypothetical protein